MFFRVKVARISNIAKDLARSLAVLPVRVVEVIPGKSVVGIEIRNESRESVRLSEVLSSRITQSGITLDLGAWQGYWWLVRRAQGSQLALMPCF